MWLPSCGRVARPGALLSLYPRVLCPQCGLPVSATYVDAEKSFWSQLWAAEMYGYDTTPIYFYASYGAWEFEGDVVMPGGPFEMAPKIVRHPVTSEADVRALKLPDPSRAGCLPVAMAFSRLQKRHGFPIIGAPHTV